MDTLKSSAPARPPNEASEDAPHGCYGGVVFLGHLVEDQDGSAGEEVEVVESVPCRRCSSVAAAGVLR